MDRITLHVGDSMVVIALADTEGPRLVYWGRPLPEAAITDPPPPVMPSGPDVPPAATLFPLPGTGFTGRPALSVHRPDGRSDVALTLGASQASAQGAVLTYTEPQIGLTLTLTYRLVAPDTLSARAHLRNTGSTALHLAYLAALCLPLSPRPLAVDLTFGSWANEGHNTLLPLEAGTIEHAGRAGRPGFGGGPGLIVCDPRTEEHRGSALGLVLATSGGFVLQAERLSDGTGQVSAGEWLAPGEVILAPGESHETPEAIAVRSQSGRQGLREHFHALARTRTTAHRLHRPVQLNSWEAVYFDVNEATARRLASDAATLGVERFVLDDGWFRGRHDDTSSLGDWTPDPDKFPNGLGPLARHVTGLGMEFGLWVEPEMVNPDSDLYRAHPDWVLAAPDRPRPTSRHQLVLDLSRPEVRDYLFDALDRLLSELPISCLKWDCNRDLFPAVSDGRPALRAQIRGLNTLLARLRGAHPDVALESCASGGGRMEFSILRHADRFWTSDATDPFERVRIQSRAGIFFPPEMLGAHVGASPNHITGRESSLVFRCLVALFGHFGLELDPATLTWDETRIIRRAIATFRTIRPLLTSGRQIMLEAPDAGTEAQMILAPDERRAALRVLRTAAPSRLALAPVHVPVLPQGSEWRISEVFLGFSDEPYGVGTFAAERLRDIGLDAQPAQAGQGRLFLMERV